MASGLAIVATNVGANGQLIGDSAYGLLVPPKDESALAAGIARHIRHPLEARRMGAAARQRVEAEFSRSAMVKRFEGFYERLLDSRN
jgi:glycosyltransferase involved in cell wall biosynthesis